MGLTEAALEHVSIKSIPLIVIAAYVLYVVVYRAVEEAKLRRLPGAPHGQTLNTHWPFGKSTVLNSLIERNSLAQSLPGLDFISRSVRSTMKHKNIEFWEHIFTNVTGWTAEARLAGLRVIFTAEPENIKAILATQFGDYGKGEPFHREWEEFLGDSIFTTDGHQWHDSRQLIRPQFVKDRVSDLHVFENHIQTLFRAIANGAALDGENQVVDMTQVSGRVMDISDLLFRYTLDVATDFLLGKDVKSMT
jgi:cytochrome P450